jgi:hypothetical protein
MRRLIAMLFLFFILGLAGCSAGDFLSNIFGGPDSDQADLNRSNPKNRGGTLAGILGN